MNKKSSDILTGRELLRIPSQHLPVSSINRRIRVIIVTLLYVPGLTLTLWTGNTHSATLTWQGGIVLTLLYGVFLFVIHFGCGNKANSLIITELGIAIPGGVGTRWNEIVSYRWEEYNRSNRVFGPTLFSLGKGTCLRIETNELIPSWNANYGRNVIATLLIFFTDEQQTVADEIFAHYGIAKKAEQ